MEKDTLLYFHRRKDTGEVFYVGIGCDERPYSKNGRSDFWFRVVNKVGYDVEIVHTDLTWDEACELEIKYIKEFGRRDLGLGNLVNLTDGGDGSKGLIFTKEHRRKIGEGNKGKKLTKRHIEILSKTHKGKTIKEEVKRKASEFHKDKILEQSTKDKISVSKQGEKNYRSKLTEQDIINIRKDYSKGGITQTKLGKKYGVRQDTISTIINRKRWKHI